MGMCSDPALKYLKNIGYNVVRLPKEGIEPLDLIGWSKNSVQELGRLSDLVTGDPATLPQPETGAAVNVNGQKSSSLKIGVGINILDGLISALGGGEIGASVNYTNAKKINFLFDDVTSTVVNALKVGAFLAAGDINQTNPVAAPYLTGKGSLLVIVDVLKSNKITVKFEGSGGIGASLDVPVIQNAVGGNIKVDNSQEASGVLTFEGDQMLTFGFKCFRIMLKDGELRMVSVPAGGAYLSVDTDDSQPEILLGADTPYSGFVDFD